MKNSRLLRLHNVWVENGSTPQKALDWSRSRDNWERDLKSFAQFISKLPNEIDRDFLRNLVKSNEYSSTQAFLTVMIWGYGDLGYGSYRVKKMFSTSDLDGKIEKVFNYCQNRQPLDAYRYLLQNRVSQLGPAFGTKLISFFSPRDVVAPIYDSFIRKWMDIHAKDVFENSSSSSEIWSLKIYSKYCEWMAFHSSLLNCYADNLEWVIFKDALEQFSRTSNWAGQ